MNKQPPPSTNAISDTALDTLLEQHTLRPPDDFVARVMSAVDTQEKQAAQIAAADSTQQLTKLAWWQWLTLLLAGTPGIAQVFALVFSAWHISSAG